jgi:hypothetical protein
MRAARLAALFDRFNRTYFGGQLPRYRIVLASGGQCWDEERVIEIGRDAVQITLIHEMCHAAAGDGGHHGPVFLSYLSHCAARGAPGANAELVAERDEFERSVLAFLRRAARHNPWNKWPLIERVLTDDFGSLSERRGWARWHWARLAASERRRRSAAT